MRSRGVPKSVATRSTIQRVHYLGSYLPSYARHRIIQAGLRELGVAVEERQDRGFLPLRWWRLATAVRSLNGTDPIIVGEASNFLSPVLLEARRLGRPVVFDTFVSLLEVVEDTETGWRRAALGPPAEFVDRVNDWAAGAVLLDTLQTRDYFVSRLGLPREKAHVVYVGAETSLFRPLQKPVREVGPFQVLFYGTFIPLHGIDVIIRAAAEVAKVSCDIRIRIVGSGQTAGEMHRLAQRLRVPNVDFGPEHVPYPQLPGLIANADICLGIFADRPQTKRVIPNKLFQCTAMGVPVVTADTPAIREGFCAHEVEMVPPGDHLALASAVLSLANDPGRRYRLGQAGMKAVAERYNSRAIASSVLKACESLYAS